MGGLPENIVGLTSRFDYVYLRLLDWFSDREGVITFRCKFGA